MTRLVSSARATRDSFCDMDGAGLTRRRLRHSQTVARYRKPISSGHGGLPMADAHEEHQPAGTKRWRKVLYEQQPFPDNYVDESFLSELKMEVEPQTDHFLYTVLRSFVVMQQLTVTAIFLTSFKYLYASILPRPTILLAEVAVLIVGYIIHILFDPACPPLRTAGLSFLLFLVCLRVCTPMLQTLTSSYSSDTIYALTILLSAVHIVWHDYQFVNNETPRFSGTISLNAAMFMTVLLASRLRAIEDVFLFAVLSVLSFAVFPVTMRIIKAKSLATHVAITISLWIFATVQLALLDKTLLACYQFLVVFVSAIGPAWMRYLHSFKRALHGPWDIPQIESLG